MLAYYDYQQTTKVFYFKTNRNPTMDLQHVPNVFHWKKKIKKKSRISYQMSLLKTVDTIGNCQTPVFSLGESQQKHKITNLWKFELNWSLKLRDNNERKKHPCYMKLCAFRCLISKPEVLKSNSWKITSFLKTNFLYYQQLSITRYQVRFYAYNYFE